MPRIAVVVRVEIVHRIDASRGACARRHAGRRCRRGCPGSSLAFEHVLEQALAEDRRRRIADRAVVVQGRFDEAVLAWCARPSRAPSPRRCWSRRPGPRCRSWPGSGSGSGSRGRCSRACRARRGGTTARRRRCRTTRSRVCQSAPSPTSQQQPPQEEEQRVAPVRRVGPVPHRLDVEMRLHHAADQLEHLVGDVDGPVGEDDGRPELAWRSPWRRCSDRRSARPGRRARGCPAAGSTCCAACAGVAADIERLPGGAGEGRAGQPAPAGVAGHRARACTRRGRAGAGGRLVLPVTIRRRPSPARASARCARWSRSTRCAALGISSARMPPAAPR